jgi:hypothetical protein
MKLAILIIIATLGLIIPLFWILGSVASIPFLWHRAGATRKERVMALEPQLGLTMADGGDVIDKVEKE